MGDALDKEMAHDAVVDDGAILQIVEKRRFKKGDIPFFAMGQSLKNSGAVMDGLGKFYFGDVVLFRSFEEDFPRYTVVAETFGDTFGDDATVFVRWAGYSNNGHE